MATPLSGRVRLGQVLVVISLSSRVPATTRMATAGVAEGLCRDGLPQTIPKAKVESLSLHSAATNGSHHLAQTRPAR